jgi:ankyrin repeat protein
LGIFLAEKLVQINAQNEAGQTALHRAAATCWVDCFSKLIEDSELDMGIADGERRTAQLRFYDIALALVRHSGIRLDARDVNGWTYAHMAAHNRNDDVLLLLINAHPEYLNQATTDGYTALHLLDEEGVEVNPVNSGRKTPLHLAATFVFVESVKLLLKT